MSRRILRPQPGVCQLCDFITTRQLSTRQLGRSIPSRTSRQFSTSRRLFAQSVQSLDRKETKGAKSFQSQSLLKAQRSNATSVATPAELNELFRDVKIRCNTLLALGRHHSDSETIQAFKACDSLAKLLVHESLASLGAKDGETSVLLSLDSSASKKVQHHGLPQSLQRIVDELSQLAYSVITHPPVFIAPEVLELYVSIQSSLSKPRTLPEIFHLYANKPLPQEGSSPPIYKPQNPNKVANAVPKAVADLALSSAIETKELVTAMDIIETTYTTKAFHRAKFIRRGLLPTTGLAVAPVAAYTVASQLALMQTTMETEMATHVAFAGILAYVGFTATIGIVAVTTANDQMDRVTWAQGMPLRQRWIREEERAAIDKVAGAWGFREVWRRGEEEGEDWDALREWIGRKGMILDKVELMEGME